MNPENIKKLVGGLVRRAERAGRGSVVMQAKLQRKVEQEAGLERTPYQDILRKIARRDPASDFGTEFPPSSPKPPRRKGMSDSYSPEGQELSEAKRKRITKLHGKYPKGTHYCATHVEHAEWGRGRTITTQHAKPDQYGDIDWYDVMFEHGVEKSVPTDDLRILLGEEHPNHEHHEYDGEEMVMEYLASFFGEELTESTDEITDEQLIEAIESINALTAIVNEYFGLNEEKKITPRFFEPYPKIDKLPDGHVRTDFSGKGITTSSMVNPKNGRTEVVHHGPKDVVDEHEKAVAKSVLRDAGPRRGHRTFY